jgi:hypothetical protein
MDSYIINKDLTETPAALNGKYTRITIPAGTICVGNRRVNEGEFLAGVVVSCKIGNQQYTNITLYDRFLEDDIFTKQAGGKRNATKKGRKNKRRYSRRN